MSAVALELPRADLLKLRKRRGLVAVVALLTVGAAAITYAVIELLHVANPAKYGPAGGVTNLGHVALLLTMLGTAAAAIVGSTAGSGDLDAGVYRDLVVTGRSRLALFGSRLAGGLTFLLPLVAAAYALAAAASVLLAGSEALPGTHLMVVTGLWVLLEVTFYYLLAIGISCLIGSRSYTIGIVLAFRLAITPLVASIGALGVVRELVPGVALQTLMPTSLGDAARQGPQIGMSVAAVAAVLVVWTVLGLVSGAWRDTTRDA